MSSQQPGQSALGQFLHSLPSPGARRCVIDYIGMTRQFHSRLDEAKVSCANYVSNVIVPVPDLTPEEFAKYNSVIVQFNSYYNEARDVVRLQVLAQEAKNEPLRTMQITETQQELLYLELTLLSRRRRTLNLLRPCRSSRDQLNTMVDVYSKIYFNYYHQQTLLMKSTKCTLSSVYGIIVVGLSIESIKLLVTSETGWESIYLNLSTDEFMKDDVELQGLVI
ncbi:hypothetical protein DIURU_005787 [Diutina rugosa]|uniref:Uncharacterized protein n=1 Tax=Diutina rugosa TaxID=5481 RepID=A0A642UJ51_DIURU|nr:uncharacterized protein DIURU_005787 [Diutina rugosa]KAA8896415.1 hypothetical protein DIURU_005787 [Diutina rugosa]